MKRGYKKWEKRGGKEALISSNRIYRIAEHLIQAKSKYLNASENPTIKTRFGSQNPKACQVDGTQVPLSHQPSQGLA
jgi:hypothetical protein